jgi:hypothetical protein
MAKQTITLAPQATIFYDDVTQILLTDHDIVEIDLPIGYQTQLAINNGHLLLVQEPPAEPKGSAGGAGSQAGAGADKPAETPPPEPHSGEPPPAPPPTETAPKGNKKGTK